MVYRGLKIGGDGRPVKQGKNKAFNLKDKEVLKKMARTLKNRKSTPRKKIYIAKFYSIKTGEYLFSSKSDHLMTERQAWVFIDNIVTQICEIYGAPEKIEN